MLGKLVLSDDQMRKLKQTSSPGKAKVTGLFASLKAAPSRQSGLATKPPSPLRQLLQDFDKNKSSTASVARPATSALPATKPRYTFPLRNSPSDPHSASAPHSSTSSNAGLGSASVRDSYRNAEALRNSPQNAASAVKVSKTILDSLTAALPSSQSIETEASEVTPGEKRYHQNQEKLRHQREKFQSSIPQQPEAPYRRPALNQQQSVPSSAAATFQSSLPKDGGFKAGTKADDSAGQDETKIIDISELKRRMAEKLSNEKKQQEQMQQRQQLNTNKGKQQASAESYKFTNAQHNSNKQKGTVVKSVSIPHQGLTLKGLASRLSVRLDVLTKTLADLGEDLSKEGGEGEDCLLEADLCELVVLEMGVDVKREEGAVDDQVGPSSKAAAAVGTTQEMVLEPRSPVVCVMGHVDHGKTTLLDSLRKANVASGEAGGITQKLSAFSVDVGGRQVVFLDTPGHAAFCKMRSNGAEATDLVILVVAIDDGVRPQTKEALRVAKEAKCTIIVALNKVDKISDPSERKTARARVLSQLVENDLMVEDYGGDVMVVEVAGKTGDGLDRLVESILLQADVMELKAASAGQAEAVVLDAYMEKGRGVVADALVRWGTLSVGDCIVVDTMFGRVKAMVDDDGNPITTAGPSTPVRLLGLRSVPTAGQELLSVASEAKARQISERRLRVQQLRQRQLQGGAPTKAATDASGETEVGSSSSSETPKVPHINVLLKADGVGTLQALEQIVSSLGQRTSDVTVSVADASIGDVSRSDVERAFTMGNALVLGFNIGLADSATRACAKELDVSIIRDTVIYRLEDSLRTAMQAQMPKERTLISEGNAKVQKVFVMRDKTATAVAGLVVQSGFLRTGSANANVVYKVTRQNGEMVLDEQDGSSAVLKRFKDTVHKVSAEVVWVLLPLLCFSPLPSPPTPPNAGRARQ